MQHMLSSAMDLNIQNGQAECTVITRTFEIIKCFEQDSKHEPLTLQSSVLSTELLISEQFIAQSQFSTFEAREHNLLNYHLKRAT